MNQAVLVGVTELIRPRATRVPFRTPRRGGLFHRLRARTGGDRDWNCVWRRQRMLAASVRRHVEVGPSHITGGSPGGRALARHPVLADAVATRLEGPTLELQLTAEVGGLLAAGGDSERRLDRVRRLVV